MSLKVSVFEAQTALSKISEDSRASHKRYVNIAGIEDYPELVGVLPRAWSCPALGPLIRRALKPPLLQQAAFDDLVFRVDVMRNVASKHQAQQTENTQAPPPGAELEARVCGDDGRANSEKAWTSLPALQLAENQNFRDVENGEENGEEGLQEVAGKLEIRVVPKPSSDASGTTYQATTSQTQTTLRPQSLPPIPTKASPSMPNGSSQHPPIEIGGCSEKAERKPIERTKSILKQSSKEGNSAGEVGSPRKEIVMFADGLVDRKEKDKACQSPRSKIRSPPLVISQTDATIIKRENETERQIQCDVANAPTACIVVDTNRKSPVRSATTMTDKQIGTDGKKAETESSSTETDDKDKGRKVERRKSSFSSNLNFEPVEALMRSQSLKSVPSNKPLSSLLNNFATDSRSESSSGASGINRPKSDAGGRAKEIAELEDRQRLVARDKSGRRIVEEGMVRCSPGVDLSTNPNVTYVTASSIPELREKRSIANGLSPGMEEQSEYFDATENPTLKDKRHELDDEDSGVDNASQILRESSTSPALEGGRISKIPVSVTGGQRLAKCMSWSGDLTPGLRRRRQGEKYVTDPSQLKLRFKRHSSSGLKARGISNCLIDAPESSPESSEGAPPPPPGGDPPSESQVRCRRFRPVT